MEYQFEHRLRQEQMQPKFHAHLLFHRQQLQEHLRRQPPGAKEPSYQPEY